MGTHKKGPSKIKYPDPLTGTLLSDWLNDNPWALGGRVAATYDGQLPFLFKVLSINTALSIQAHPDKTRAAKLHSQQPENYPDSNHKPEMVVAYKDFEGLCGFRKLEEVQQWLKKVEEFQKVSVLSCLVLILYKLPYLASVFFLTKPIAFTVKRSQWIRVSS